VRVHAQCAKRTQSMLSFRGSGGMHPQKTSALKLNLEAILANSTDHSEELDSLPASLTL